jgi:hypothetical protein
MSPSPRTRSPSIIARSTGRRPCACAWRSWARSLISFCRTDAIPDFLPVVGFTDDAAVFAATLQLVAAYVLPEHREAARRALADLDTAQPQ